MNYFFNFTGTFERQKKDVKPALYEVDKLKCIRNRSFYNWSYSPTFCSQMARAGFFSCNDGDRVICMYCDLICHKWDVEIDDPYEVHKELSPHCLFVKSMSYSNNLPNSNTRIVLPIHINYADPEKRLASFSVCSEMNCSSKEKLVNSGFFCNGSQIACFCCNGSLHNWSSNNHPLAEHIWRFPHCNYAKQLCYKELYDKIQLTKKSVSG